MIHRELRMKREDFSLIHKKQCKKNSFRGEFLLFKIFLCSSSLKFSVSVSKKKIKSAVKRNTIKRRVYELVGKYKTLFDSYPQGAYITISFIGDKKNISFSDLERDFLLLKERIKNFTL